MEKQNVNLCCFVSRSRIFLLYGDATIISDGLQNLGICSALGDLYNYHATPAVTQSLGLSAPIKGL
jgi:hypothetical protein